MIAMLIRARLQVDSTCPATASVTSTAAVASATTRRKAMTERYAGESPTTTISDFAPERPSSNSSAARTRDMRKMAASAAESTKATTMLMRAGRTSCGSIKVSRGVRGGRSGSREAATGCAAQLWVRGQAPGRPRVARKVSSSWRWSSNISRSSSGSAWS